jgi:hypothetical protein
LNNKEKRIQLLRELLVMYTCGPKDAYSGITSYSLSKTIVDRLDAIDELRIEEPVK